MNVLSLFDGISCGQIALERAGIKVDKYFASEIKDIAIKVTQSNYPNTIQLGDVTKLDASTLPKIDLLIGGSPCQNFSSANLNYRDGLDGEKSSLFYQYYRLLKELNPKYFLLENVRMKKDQEAIINNLLGVKPIAIISGTATTGVAALRTERKYIGIEKEPVYQEIAKDRLKKEVYGLYGK